MSITVSNLIQRAYRENNLIPIGKEPTEVEINESLEVYRSLVASYYGAQVGTLLQDWEAPPSPTSPQPSRFPNYPQKPYVPIEVWVNPPPNVRIIYNQAAGAQTVYFPPNPNDGARVALVNVGDAFSVTNTLTLQGNGRLIEGATSLTVNAPFTVEPVWQYVADSANWVRISELTLESENPFPAEFDDFSVAMLAIRRAPTYGKDPNPMTASIAQGGMTMFKARYWQSAPAAPFPGAWRFNTYQSYGTPWRWGGAGW